MRRMSETALREADPADLTPWEQAWQDYLQDNPEVLASFGYQNGYWPPGHPSRNAQGESVAARDEAEEGPRG